MKKAILIALLCCTSTAALAQDTAPASANSEQPIEITAQKSVEWHRNDKKYIARDNVVITQGDVTILSDLATADYREGATSSMEIYQLTAEKNVTIDNGGNKATGDKAVYDVDKAVAVLTGNDLRLTSPDQVVTAKERMEYYPNTRQAKAIGNAKVVRAKDTLSANTITATFKDGKAPAAQPNANAPATGNLDRIDAEGNVVIVTPTETLRGNRGVYKAATNTAEITGNVKIERGPNIIEGQRAEVDLTTNVSKMFGGENSGGRVRGLFFPGSQPNSGGKAPSPAPSNPATVTP
jgi:lipopolysaccharide export system protein LptA